MPKLWLFRDQIQIQDGGTPLKNSATKVCVFVLLMAALSYAQQIDAAISGGTVSTPGASSSATSLPSLGGGTYFGFNGDVLIRHNLGLGGELSWKTSQGLYAGQVPYRPIFWDIDGIYARRFTKTVGVDALAGIGAESLRFYGSSFTNCDQFGNCTNYTSSNHFMGVIGGGVRFYPYHSFFVRPEVRWYLVHNNVEFDSGHPVRYGISIGYTFGGSQ